VTLRELLKGTAVTVTAITYDSRKVKPGAVFVALRGVNADGARFVPQAIANGAIAVVAETVPPPGLAVPWLQVPSARAALAELAALFYGNPSEELALVGITGTNGKTTTAYVLASIFEAAGIKCGRIGTIGYRIGAKELDAPRTTPEAPELQQMLREMLKEGCGACVMEVSSHALALRRADELRFAAGIFTNLTRDHLDFHGDMESYYAAKKRLFDRRKPAAVGVVNADDPYGRRLLAEIAPPRASYSASGADAEFRAENARCDLSGVAFELAYPGGRIGIVSPLLGRFQLANLTAAATAGLVLGIPPADVAAAVHAVAHVPGRLERVEAGQPYPILVDYAHTPDALERLLQAVRELSDRKILLVFGCGGDRDRGKRAPMGEIAGRMADIAIATSDNPRTEDPDAILREVEAGLAASGATKYLKIADRREAIRQALDLANPGTVVVIAGKGHETTQVIGETAIPFDDRKVAAELARRG
jgi:UDP-N-acetylmuramoyl-L-alanyl-D-glutamate--2,6-diaminopimelate ligase